MKKLFAIAIPVLPGKTAQFRKFIKELGTTQAAAFEESRKKLGVRERTFFQSTPMGDFVIVTLEGENPAQAFGSFGKNNDEFTRWFAKEVKDIHGIDITNPPKDNMPELIADSMSPV